MVLEGDEEVERVRNVTLEGGKADALQQRQPQPGRDILWLVSGRSLLAASASQRALAPPWPSLPSPRFACPPALTRTRHSGLWYLRCVRMVHFAWAARSDACAPDRSGGGPALAYPYRPQPHSIPAFPRYIIAQCTPHRHSIASKKRRGTTPAFARQTASLGRRCAAHEPRSRVWGAALPPP